MELHWLHWIRCLNWIGNCWIELNWIVLDWLELHWSASNSKSSLFLILKWTEPNRITFEVKWIKLDWVELIWIEMHCIGLNWSESNDIELFSWIDLNGIEWTDHYSDDLPNLLGIQCRQAWTHIQVFWRPSQTYTKSDRFPLWNCSRTALAYIPLCWRPSRTLWKSDTFPLWICSWLVLAGTDPYSTILATFTHLLEIQYFWLSEFAPGQLWQPLVHISQFWGPSQLEIHYCSFMNLLPDGFDGHGPIFHYSDNLHKPIGNPNLFLCEIAPGRRWRAWTPTPLF